MKQTNKSVKAFTLVELAIVLVIIGLITGGVIGAQSLINSAKLNATLSQLNNYNVGLKAFILEYDAIPGDFDEAYDYGITHNKNGDQLACRAANNDGDGDGDKKLEDRAFSGIMRYQSELANFWVHMQLAEIIDGSLAPYQVHESCNHNTKRANYDFPESQGIGETIFALQNETKIGFILGGFAKTQDNLTQINTVSEAANGSIAENLLSPNEAFKVDRKIDDGEPLSGLVKVASYYEITHTDGNTDYGGVVYDPNDNDTNCVYNADYNKGYSEKACTLEIQASGY